MKSKVSKFVNIALITLIAFMAYQKFVVNRPQKQIDLQQLVIEDLNGNVIDWNDLKGKGIFLNFWASWCGPCMAEMPSIQSSIEHFKGQQIVYIIANTQSLDDAKSVLAKEKYKDMPFYVLKSAGSIPISSIPLTYLINSNGEVEKVHAGVNHWNTPMAQSKISGLIDLSH